MYIVYGRCNCSPAGKGADKGKRFFQIPNVKEFPGRRQSAMTYLHNNNNNKNNNNNNIIIFIIYKAQYSNMFKALYNKI